MVEALISVAFDRLTSFIQQGFQQKVGLVIDVEEDVKKLSNTFAAIQIMIEDAEKKHQNDNLARIWLEKVKEVACDIDNVLDEWSTEIKRSQLDNARNGKRKVQSILSNPSNVISDWMQRNGIAGRIKDIRERLEEIEQSKDKFCSNAISKSKAKVQLESTSMVNEAEVFGRDSDKYLMVNVLLNSFATSVHKSGGISVVCVLGMPGIGKTTLAQIAFSDRGLVKHFDRRIWVCVSEAFDARKVTNAIMEQLEDNVPHFIEWEPLQQRLGSSISGKRFLLVLDGIRTPNFNEWDALRLPLSHGAPGSKILVTSHNEGVALMLGATDIHTLGPLSEMDCWKLFTTVAFTGKTRKESESLEEIGKLITKKCEGSPHAAKTIGSLLRFRRTKQDWYNILVGNRWQLSEAERGMYLEPLLSSFYILPPYLKPCLGCCANIPKGCVIEKDYIVKLWMANGFLGSKERREPELVGEEYFNTLVRHLYFHEVVKNENDNIVSCKLQSSVYDLLDYLAMDECYFMKNEQEEEPDLGNIRHLILLESDEIPICVCNAKALRTISSKWNRRRLRTIPDELFSSSSRIRALDLSNNYFCTVPSEIENLIHLRLLDLSGGFFEQLPETTTSLYNLQTLRLNDCGRLHELPSGMENLVNLRHLEIDGTYSLTHLPRGVGRLKSLRTLSRFIVSKGSQGCGIQHLKDLNQLQGMLRIHHLANIIDRRTAALADLWKKQHLRTVILDFKVPRERGEEALAQSRVVEVEGLINYLRPHQNVENLEIWCYPGTRLPSFIGMLPNLEKLVIYGMDSIKYMGHEFFGFVEAKEMPLLFPKMREIKFHQMNEWELCYPSMKEHSENKRSKFILAPSLCVLTLSCCLKLKMLPHSMLFINHIRELILCTCPNLSWTSSCLLLPNLQKLTLDGDAGVLSRSIISNLIFLPNLKFLKIISSPHWALPEGFEQCNKLHELEISYCHHIEFMPNELHYLIVLQDLKIICCDILGPRCQKDGGDEWHKISHIPNVFIKIIDDSESSGTTACSDSD